MYYLQPPQRLTNLALLPALILCCYYLNADTSNTRSQFFPGALTVAEAFTISMPPDINARRPMTATTLRSLSSLSISNENVQELDIVKLSQEMNERAKEASAFTLDEIDEIMQSLQNVMPADSNTSIDLDTLRKLIESVGHLPHKEWDRTGKSAQKLNDILLGGSTDGLTDEFKHMFKRVIEEGNWDAAAQHAQNNDKPWAILVTGVNGIRKTTSVYQPWFQELLNEALVCPQSDGDRASDLIPKESLPTGENSFFRQLDHMIITLINHNFQKMYAMTSLSHDFTSEDGADPPTSIIQNYSNYKAAMFTRYRTLSEILGVLLVRQAQSASLNVMVETSGRDVAMFHYVDSFFPSDKYNKLALHFTINDLSHAEESVDKRMVKEMKDGFKALQSGVVENIIKANAGGPYGSEVLQGIQKDSDRVWDEIISEDGSCDVGGDWFKATIKIEAKKDEDWTARAVLPDGGDGSEFTFQAPRNL